MSAAGALPSKIYTFGKPCKHGHGSARWVHNNHCVECHRLETRDRKRRKKEASAGRPRPDSCEVCGATGKICWDHDHSSGLFRGWICNACNYVLGLVKDDADHLLKLADYLRANKRDLSA